LIQDGVNGILVPCGDPRTLARVLESALRSDEGSLSKMAEEGHSEMSLKYSKESVVESYLGLYTQLIASGRLT
jgi:glycosyltransferase involved in cell wall biosynthesis